MSISEDGIRGKTKSIKSNFVQHFNKCFSISLYNHSVLYTVYFQQKVTSNKQRKIVLCPFYPMNKCIG